jgi:flagellar basal body-associated protein FliL
MDRKKLTWIIAIIGLVAIFVSPVIYFFMVK